ncbi:hypothetical protein BsWGS_10629 [Bradybaena similaris]
MSHSTPTPRSQDATTGQAGAPCSRECAPCDQPPGRQETVRGQQKHPEDPLEEEDTRTGKRAEVRQDSEDICEESDGEDASSSHVLITGEEQTYPEDSQREPASGRTRPKLTTSNSGAEIMLGLQTDDGKSAEVEIDSLETDELQPEEIPKGRVRKTSIVEKLSKSKESELMALSILENAGQRQREFEKLISEHQELVHEISRTPSTENIVQSDTGRDP